MATQPVIMKVDRLKEVLAGIRAVPTKDVLVGIPEDGGAGEMGARSGSNFRMENAGEHRAMSDITNAQLGYLHEHGVPERNIPARPFLMPGVRDARNRISGYLKQAAEAALDGHPERMERALGAAGMAAMSSVQRKIRSGPFAPLAPATIAARRIRSKGSSYRRKATQAGDVTPLIDTAQMLRSVTYVVRDKV